MLIRKKNVIMVIQLSESNSEFVKKVYDVTVLPNANVGDFICDNLDGTNLFVLTKLQLENDYDQVGEDTWQTKKMY